MPSSVKTYVPLAAQLVPYGSNLVPFHSPVADVSLNTMDVIYRRYLIRVKKYSKGDLYIGINNTAGIAPRHRYQALN